MASRYYFGTQVAQDNQGNGATNSNRLIENFRNQKTSQKANHALIDKGDWSAHHGSAIEDAYLYYNSIRTDHQTYFLLYGLLVNEVWDYLGMSTSPGFSHSSRKQGTDKVFRSPSIHGIA